jgi:hypothetical protein
MATVHRTDLAPRGSPDPRIEKGLEDVVENVDEYIDPQDGSRHQIDSTTKLDPHGFPLSPQPSDFKDDPLVGITHLPNVTCAESLYRTGRPD